MAENTVRIQETAQVETRVQVDKPTPADDLHQEMAALDREIQGVETGVPLTEEPDPRKLYPGIGSALATLGNMTPGVGMLKVNFNLVPMIVDYSGGAVSPSAGRIEGWQASASVDVYGGLKTSVNEEDPEQETDLGAVHLQTFHIEGAPKARVGDAILSLSKAVQDKIEREKVSRNQDLFNLETALKELGGDADLSRMWPLRDSDSDGEEPQGQDEA